jgi:hypothetical protein
MAVGTATSSTTGTRTGSWNRSTTPFARSRLLLEDTGSGIAWGDVDDDGDLDLYVAGLRGGRLWRNEGIGTGGNREGPLLLRNDCERSGASLTVRLEGPEGLRRGARVEVEAGGRVQVRWYQTDASFLSAHAPELIVGLGDATAARRVTVRWTDGSLSAAHDVAPGRIVLRYGEP